MRWMQTRPERCFKDDKERFGLSWSTVTITHRLQRLLAALYLAHCLPILAGVRASPTFRRQLRSRGQSGILNLGYEYCLTAPNPPEDLFVIRLHQTGYGRASTASADGTTVATTSPGARRPPASSPLPIQLLTPGDPVSSQPVGEHDVPIDGRLDCPTLPRDTAALDAVSAKSVARLQPGLATACGDQGESSHDPVAAITGTAGPPPRIRRTCSGRQSRWPASCAPAAPPRDRARRFPPGEETGRRDRCRR